MKKIFLFSAISVLCSATTLLAKVPGVGSVPKVDLGVKLGANFARLGGNNWEQTYKPGINFGAILGLHEHKLGMQVEFLVNSAHYTTKGLVDSAHKGDFRAVYFDIPLLFEYKLLGSKVLPKVWIMAGPQFSSLLSVKGLNEFSKDAEKNMKSTSFSAVGGIEIRFMKVTVGGRYILGLTDVNQPTVGKVTETWNSKSYQLYAGFRFL